jgi:hypothetical protein
VLRVVSQPFCEVIMLDRWDAEPSRYFTAYSARGASRWILGHPVVDEYATISSPIFLTPRRLLGKIYNAGISLGHRRDHEMGLDLGWPPLCIGLEKPAPELPEDWEAKLLAAIMSSVETSGVAPTAGELTRIRRNGHEIDIFRLAGATVTAISTPLLPNQLSRVCEAMSTSVSVAVSLGNRIEHSKEGRPQPIHGVSEATLHDILATAQGPR